MTSYELAIDQEGEPFTVPPEVTGWRVRRALDGRGRPELIYKAGKPLIVRLTASHADLLAAAGPGKYRLDPVDALGHVVAEVPVACTGPLREVESAPSELGSSTGPALDSPAARIEDVLCQVVAANTRMVEKALGQLGTVMSGVAELLHAAHSAGITTRVPPPPPPPAPLPAELHEDEEDEEDEAEGEEAEEPASAIPEVMQLIIKEAVAKVVPLIFEKLTSGSGLGGLPLEAILDWRKAVPTAAPSVPTTPSAPPPPTPAPVPPPAPVSPPAPASVPNASNSAVHAPHAAAMPASPAAPAMAGAAPSRESSPGAAPAEAPTASHASAPRTQEDAAAMLNAHVLQIWQGLSPPERARTTQLIARLTAEERTAWLAELARLTVPEAIARARAVIQAQTPPATPPLPTTTPQGDPS